MSAAPTFDTEKKQLKNRNGGILRLRLAYGRRSNKYKTAFYTIWILSLFGPQWIAMYIDIIWIVTNSPNGACNAYMHAVRGSYSYLCKYIVNQWVRIHSWLQDQIILSQVGSALLLRTLLLFGSDLDYTVVNNEPGHLSCKHGLWHLGHGVQDDYLELNNKSR